jgi:hypothetical protein
MQLRCHTHVNLDRALVRSETTNIRNLFAEKVSAIIFTTSRKKRIHNTSCGAEIPLNVAVNFLLSVFFLFYL